MDFTIRKNARKWFKGIRESGRRSKLELDFDIFYFCFIAGITENRKASPSTKDTAQLVENFPGRYKHRGELLIALFLSRELHNLGVTMSEKRVVREQIGRLLKHNEKNYLSDEGVREFNKYAHGGFDVLQEWLHDRPQSLETFLRSFQLKVGGAAGWKLSD